MTQAASANPSLARRVAHVIVVALCTASTLALLGAKHAENAGVARKPAAPVVAKQVVAVPDKPQAAVTSANVLPVAAEPELMIDAPEAVPVVAVPLVEATPKTRVIRMEVTAYCPCVKCCGPNAQGITASGKLVNYNGGRFVAADTSVLPFGTKLTIPGYADNQAVEVIDRGGAIKGNKLDLYFDSHTDALIWGRQHLDVTVSE